MVPQTTNSGDPFDISQDDSGARLDVTGDWTIDRSAKLFDWLENAPLPDVSSVTLDFSRIGQLDTTGAWLLHRTRRRLEAAGSTVTLAEVSADQMSLLELAKTHDRSDLSSKEPVAQHAYLVGIGRAVEDFFIGCRRGLAFLGLVLSALARSVIDPRRLAIAPMFHQMEVVGYQALPIVGLISFLIGVVIAYQGIMQLRLFGAEVFAVELIGVSILRELAILLTAIVVAGRSGSAFTAQIGSMKLNEEIDAMRTLGLDPIDRLVVPRVLALLLMLPLLGFYADIMGLLGGALMTAWETGMSLQLFAQRLNEGLVFSNFAVGIMKAPAFALVISIAGCYEGFQVEGSAESVGYRTTKSVVESIFMVIVLDALFSIVFAVLDL